MDCYAEDNVRHSIFSTKIRVYILSGSSGQGKTTTLNKLADALNRHIAWKQIDGFNPPLTGGWDGQYVFERTDGLRVGISTAGDGVQQIKNGFQYFKQHNCVVCFIASKLYGVSVQEIESQCATINVIPQYQFLHGEHIARSRNKIQADIVDQLFAMI